MEYIYSKIDPELLLHTVHRYDEFEDGRVDLVDEKQFIQISALKMEYGKSFKPHKHIWKTGEPVCIAQESWVVLKGRVRVFFYDVDGTFLNLTYLDEGDCSVTLQGGHTYEIVEDGTRVLEYKTGPYKGQELDKVFFDDKN